jgi:hypothetical protein
MLAAGALAVAGCGGDDETTTSTATATPETVQKCLEEAGLTVSPDKPTADGMEAVLYINPDRFDQVYLAFMDDEAGADRIAEGLRGLAPQAGGNAGAEVVDGTIVLATARDTTMDQVNDVKACL